MKLVVQVSMNFLFDWNVVYIVPVLWAQTNICMRFRGGKIFFQRPRPARLLSVASMADPWHPLFMTVLVFWRTLECHAWHFHYENIFFLILGKQYEGLSVRQDTASLTTNSALCVWWATKAIFEADWFLWKTLINSWCCVTSSTESLIPNFNWVTASGVLHPSPM